ncbi:hypothetical protein TNCV_3568881 [Trichonephila clavipes]|nr:hypothetical protein TNCV_3568881 [Trichonephila clavipes]
MDTTRENNVLPPLMVTNMSSLAKSNTLPWTDRVEHSTPSLNPGCSLCPDGGQNPSISPVVEQQIDLKNIAFHQMHSNKNLAILLDSLFLKPETPFPPYHLF